MAVPDDQVQELWRSYSHVLPGISLNHLQIYLLLWGVTPKSANELILLSGLARATVYKMLTDLGAQGLVEKNSNDAKYFAQSPLGAYCARARRSIRIIKHGKSLIKGMAQKQLGGNCELYVVPQKGRPHMLIQKATRSPLKDEYQLREIRKAIDYHLLELGCSRSRAWEAYR